MSSAVKPSRGLHHGSLRDFLRKGLPYRLLYGLCGGVVIMLLKVTEYRFLVVEHSVEIYGRLVAEQTIPGTKTD